MSDRSPDLTGQVFGHWTVLAPAESGTGGRKRYLCRCSCGAERVVAAQNLRRGLSTSCGHPGRESRRDDLTGQRFGRLTAVRYVCRRGGNSIWECVCDCGRVCQSAANNLKCGHTQSCGCQLAEAQSDATARVAAQATSPKCAKVDSNAHAKSFVLRNARRTWEGRNLINFVRQNGDLFGVEPNDESQAGRVARALYDATRRGTSWYGWRLEWTDQDNAD